MEVSEKSVKNFLDTHSPLMRAQIWEKSTNYAPRRILC